LEGGGDEALGKKKGGKTRLVVLGGLPLQEASWRIKGPPTPKKTPKKRNKRREKRKTKTQDGGRGGGL